MMKKGFLALFVCLLPIYAFAQMEDDFETNQFGWNEISSKRGIALIQNGAMHLESRPGQPILITTYAPFDINKPFALNCEALVKKLESGKIFGIVLDYEDEQNHMLFYLNEDEACLEVVKEGKVVANRYYAVALKSGKKVGIDFQIEYNLNELVFYVNGMKAMTYRRRIVNNEYLLGTSGIGFFAKNGQVIDFDNLVIVQ